MKSISKAVAIFAVSSFLLGCETVNYVKSEVTGTAKPEGGIQEVVPPSKIYSASSQALRRAVLQMLDEQGYIYEDNSSSGTIKTEPKTLTNKSPISFIGAYYQARLFIKLEGQKITYRAQFDKKSKLTTDVVHNIDYPEKENELRKDFFDALSKKLNQ